jgi:DNA-binding transcriptional regulator YhcF (GntR family)
MAEYMDKETEITNRLRSHLIAGLHIGRLGPGSRLKSIREAAEEYGIDHRIVARAYERLSDELLVEVRGRSGVFVRAAADAREGLTSARQVWLADVLNEARARRITFAELHQMMNVVTMHGLRCLCLESTTDHLVACASELATDFGFEVTPVRFTATANGGPVEEEEEYVRSRFAGTDVVVSTAFHAGTFRKWAEDAGKPFVSVVVNPAIRDEIARRMREGVLRVVIADRAFLTRAQSFMGPDIAPNLEVVLANDYNVLKDKDEVPTLFTKAARRQLALSEFHLLSQEVPFISLESGRELTRVIASHARA